MSMKRAMVAMVHSKQSVYSVFAAFMQKKKNKFLIDRSESAVNYRINQTNMLKKKTERLVRFACRKYEIDSVYILLYNSGEAP